MDCMYTGFISDHTSLMIEYGGEVKRFMLLKYKNLVNSKEHRRYSAIILKLYYTCDIRGPLQSA